MTKQGYHTKICLLVCAIFFIVALCCTKYSGCTANNGLVQEYDFQECDVRAYVTTADRTALFAEKAVRYSNVPRSSYTVIIDTTTVFQTIDGFGPSITGSSCYNLMKMTPEDRSALLRECFDPDTGAGYSFIRVHIGGSDFSLGEYTCCDEEGIENFAIPNVEKEGIFPVLREILAINPDLKIMGSPWSCPIWMKGTVRNPHIPYYSWTGGRLNPKYYDDYAEYFVRWIKEMEQSGFPIYAITIQNEPLNKGNSMSLYMPWQDQLAFVKKLGPAFEKAGLSTKIICYDHNYNYSNIADQADYPLNLYADKDAAKWIDGSAWHNYEGNVSELDKIVAAAPDKNIYFTEASIGSWNYTFEDCVIYDFEMVFMETLKRNTKAVLLWNFLLDENGSPNRPGGCRTCYGAIEISSSDYKTLKYNSHFYNIAHCSKVILAGAVRIGAYGYAFDGLSYLAFKNPDGSMAFISLNKSDSPLYMTVYETDDRSFEYTVPAKSIVSFRWNVPKGD